MKDGSKLFLMGISTILATLFAFASMASVFAFIALIVLKLVGICHFSWFIILVVPPVLFVVSTMLQAVFIVLSKLVER